MRAVSHAIALLAVIAISAAVRAAPPAPEQLAAIDAKINSGLKDWIEFYKHRHAHPELSLHEEASGDDVAKQLTAIGLKVTSHIGGFGVVGILDNGDGPTVLIRGDMDALPVTEETGLPFASKIRVAQPDGTSVGVMHACGHDVHQTVLIATAQVLASMKPQWKGRVIFVAQPAEEIGRGAEAMIKTGLYEKNGKPDACIALHVSHELETGTVGVNSGWVYANVDSVDITIHGKGGHGAYPHETVDPIVTASQLVLALQTIVSRRMNPQDPSVITVGSIHAGTKHNIIPDDAHLQLTVRSYTDAARKKLLSSIEQVAIDICKAANCPKPPTVNLLSEDFTPATFNDPKLALNARTVFESLLGANKVFERPPSMGGEDFSQFSRMSGRPGFMFQLGVVDHARFEASKKPGAPRLPAIHSSRFQVDPEPTLRTGVRCMSALALSLLSSKAP